MINAEKAFSLTIPTESGTLTFKRVCNSEEEFVEYIKKHTREVLAYLSTHYPDKKK